MIGAGRERGTAQAGLREFADLLGVRAESPADRAVQPSRLPRHETTPRATELSAQPRASSVK
jgi:hypothetical protein